MVIPPVEESQKGNIYDSPQLFVEKSYRTRFISILLLSYFCLMFSTKLRHKKRLLPAVLL
jgi:hypothetical protein